MMDDKTPPKITDSEIDTRGAAAAVRVNEFKRNQSALSLYLAELRIQRLTTAAISDEDKAASWQPEER